MVSKKRKNLDSFHEDSELINDNTECNSSTNIKILFDNFVSPASVSISNDKASKKKIKHEKESRTNTDRDGKKKKKDKIILENNEKNIYNSDLEQTFDEKECTTDSDRDGKKKKKNKIILENNEKNISNSDLEHTECFGKKRKSKRCHDDEEQESKRSRKNFEREDEGIKLPKKVKCAKDTEINSDDGNTSIFSEEPITQSENETDPDHDQNFENVLTNKITKNKKKHKDKGRKENVEHYSTENETGLEYDQNSEDVSSNDKTSKKREKHKEESPKKRLKACENISFNRHVSGGNETTDTESFNGKDKSKSKEVEKKKSLVNFISPSLLHGLMEKLDEMNESDSNKCSSSKSKNILVQECGKSTNVEENSEDFIPPSQFCEDTKAKQKRKKDLKKKSKKKSYEECNEVNQDATVVIGDNPSDSPEKDPSASKLKVQKTKPNHLVDFISSSLIDDLTSKLDEIIKTDSKVPVNTETIRKSNKYEEISRKTESASSELNGVIKTDVSSIPNSVLDSLMEQFDKIVEEDHRNSLEDSEETVENCNQKSAEVETKGQTKKQNIKDKRKIIKLLKETKSIKRIKEELNIKDDDGLEKLKNLTITLPWSLPIIHTIAPNASLRPTPEQREALKAEGIKLKVGKYTAEEDEKLRQNWKIFCRYHDWDEEQYQPFLKGSTNSKYGILDGKKYQKFVQFISHNFENRLMYNIYQRFQRLFSQNDIDCDAFTPEDDEIIKKYVHSETGNTPFADLAVLLKRPRLALLKRYKRLQAAQSFTKTRIQWDEYLARKLINNIVKVTKSKRVSELKNRNITTAEWEKIAVKMELPANKLKRVWVVDFYTRLVNPFYDEQFTELKYKILKTLSKEYTDWREIDWQYVAEKIDTKCPYNKLYKVFHDMIQAVPKEQRKDLKACLEHLNDMRFKNKGNKYAFVAKIFEEMETNAEEESNEKEESDEQEESGAQEESS